MNLNLAPYKFTNDEIKKLNLDFLPVIEDVNLDSIDKSTNKNMPSNYCVYFWVMSYKGDKYKIYIGKTKSLKERFNDYSRDFQIHSPNDFKLHFFQNFIRRHFNNTSLNLYFMKCSKDDYTKRETDAIDIFKPAINERAKVSIEMKNKVKKSFSEYYQEIFTNKLST